MINFEDWLMTEGIRVNYKEFEKMKAALKEYMNKLDQFHTTVVNAAAKKSPEKARYLSQYYDQLVAQERKNIIMAYRWLDQQIAELMKRNQMQQDPRTKQWARSPAGRL